MLIINIYCIINNIKNYFWGKNEKYFNFVFYNKRSRAGKIY